jgi:hypothetical protein
MRKPDSNPPLWFPGNLGIGENPHPEIFVNCDKEVLGQQKSKQGHE